MRIVSLSCLLLGLVVTAGCGRLPGQPTPSQVPLEPQQVTNFVALYRENCAGCHGSHGQGNAALSLSNPVYQALVDDATLRRVIAQGVPHSLMPAFARSAGGFLTDAQVDILVRGLRANWSKPNAAGSAKPPPYAAPTNAPGEARRGEAVFAKFCARCHGADGTGGGKMGSIVDGSYLALISNQGLRTTVIAGRPERGHPDWRNCLPGEPMSPAQVSDVVAWLISKRPAQSGQPYASSSETRN
ncbi:MAG: c-type cytochrome [Verrucomicrobia bacterium]|nr:c-type cytochrome [Verrucomicrobiota bacterium]